MLHATEARNAEKTLDLTRERERERETETERQRQRPTERHKRPYGHIAPEM